MSSEWKSVSVGDVTTLVTKGTTPTSLGFSFQETGVRFVKVESLTNEGQFLADKFAFISEDTHKALLRSQLQIDDVLFTIAGTIGRTAIVNAKVLPANTNQAIAIVRADKDFVEPRFLRYVLSNPSFTQTAESKTVQSVQSNFSLGELKQAKFFLPSLNEQKSILGVLGSLDDQITLLRETNETLEAIAQAIFKSWFVDFDPVKAKAAGLVPGGIDEATAALFPDSFVASDSGLIPAGWSSKPIGDVASIVGGSTPDTKNPDLWEPAEFNWTSPKDLSGLQSPVLLDTDRKISAAGLAKISSGLLPAGTLLLSSRAPIGYLAISQIPIAINQGYIAMPPGAKLPPLYLYFWCKQNMEEIKARSNGSTFMEISKSAFRPIPAVLPPPKIIEAFMSVAGVLFEEIVAQQEEIKTLSEFRDTLLPRLISGKLRIPETQEAVEEMA